ncbi:MAG: hypothetical protein CMM58_00405 [Rhodospirillaceae bacterium]|nr:hypothetical protein [Rhodospirillaceae bacterium]|tara:strand:+ start:1517 stop:2386 length:870 start_codon:yes stop_codon:yes gene_type:complete
MTQILIAGANGYVGNFLVNDLDSLFDLTAVSRTEPSFRQKNTKVIRQDLSQRWEFDATPEIVIYLAAQHYYSTTAATIENFLSSNVQGLINALTFSEAVNAKMFIYFSSISVLGKVNDQVVTEQTPICTPNLYGATKFLGERIVYDFSTQVPSLIIRLPGIVGPNLPEGRPWIKSVIDKLLRGDPVHFYNGEADFNNICDLQTICHFIQHIAGRGLPNNFDIVNLAATTPIKVKNLILLLHSRLNSTSTINEVSTNNLSFTIDVQHISSTYAFFPPTTECIVQRLATYF